MDADRTADQFDARIDENFPVREQQGILSRIQRRWAWVGFLLVAINGPIVAKAMGGDSWTLSVTVASIVAFVIVIDDVQRRRQPTKSPFDGPVE